MPVIELTTYVAAPPEVCYDAVLDVDVQVRLDARTRAVGGVTSGSLRAGDTVTWRAVHFGLPWQMTSAIVDTQRPAQFSDAMRRGPFAHWRHTHRFVPLASGTIMQDWVDYGAPLGFLGRMFDELVLYRYLAGLLAMRNQQLKHIVEGVPGRVVE